MPVLTHNRFRRRRAGCAVRTGRRAQLQREFVVGGEFEVLREIGAVGIGA